MTRMTHFSSVELTVPVLTRLLSFFLFCSTFFRSVYRGKGVISKPNVVCLESVSTHSGMCYFHYTGSCSTAVDE